MTDKELYQKLIALRERIATADLKDFPSPYTMIAQLIDLLRENYRAKVYDVPVDVVNIDGAEYRFPIGMSEKAAGKPGSKDLTVPEAYNAGVRAGLERAARYVRDVPGFPGVAESIREMKNKSLGLPMVHDWVGVDEVAVEEETRG